METAITVDEQLEDLKCLAAVCHDILTYDSNTKIVKSGNTQRKAYAVFLDKYIAVLGVPNQKFQDHKHSIYTSYEKMRVSILQSASSDEWMGLEESMFWFGVEKDEIKKKNVKIILYVFYGLACDINQVLELKLTPKEKAESKEYMFCEELLYYTLKCYRHAITGSKYESDQSKLDEIIMDIESNLGIEDGVKKQLPQQSGTGAAAAPGFQAFMGNMIGGLANMADNMGVKLPDGRSISDLTREIKFDDIQKSLATTLSNPDLINNITSAVTGATSAVAPVDGQGQVPGQVESQSAVAPVDGQVQVPGQAQTQPQAVPDIGAAFGSFMSNLAQPQPGGQVDFGKALGGLLGSLGSLAVPPPSVSGQVQPQPQTTPEVTQ